MNETYLLELFFDSSMIHFFFNENIIMCFLCGFWGTHTCKLALEISSHLEGVWQQMVSSQLTSVKRLFFILSANCFEIHYK